VRELDAAIVEVERHRIESPLLADLFAQRAAISQDMGQQERAVVDYSRSLELRRKLGFGADDQREHALTGIAMAEMAQRKYEAALPRLEEAWSIVGTSPRADPYRRGVVGFTLGQALWESSKDRRRGCELARQSAAGIPKNEPVHSQMAQWLARFCPPQKQRPDRTAQSVAPRARR
jgi:hypothetical protein